MSSISTRYLLPALLLGLLASASSLASAAPPTPLKVQLADNPALSPDGKRLVFAWHGDLWSVASTGGVAKRLTHHDGADKQPRFSPDGKTIAFTSSRTGTTQVFTMPANGGPVTQVTHHTGGNECAGWFPDGEALLVRGQRDHWWKTSQVSRYFKVALGERRAEELLFDDYGDEGTLSPDGTQMLFTREGPAWWRKGYYGSQAAQIWLYDLKEKSFRQILAPETGARYPLWKPDGKSFYYVGNGTTKSWNLNEYDLATSKSKTLTSFDDDSVVQPTLSADGKTLVFRRLFDLYRWQPDVNQKNGKPGAPKKLDITVIDDDVRDEPFDRKILTSAKDFAVTRDGLEIAFIAGGDLWVMDTILREPKQVTDTPEEESEPVFTADQTALLFVSNAAGQCDIWKAEKSEANRYWWTNSKFNLKKLTDDATVESSLALSPKGDKLAFVRGLGDLITMNLDGTDVKQIFASWDKPDYDWSPDGKWFAYAVSDRDFNNDVWIVPSDASAPAVNISRHPDNDFRPRWSPDGKLLTYTGRRADDQTDIFYVYLRAADEETNTRDRNFIKALEKMQKRNLPSSAAKKPEPGKEPEPMKEPEPKKELEAVDEVTESGVAHPGTYVPGSGDDASVTSSKADQQPMPMDPPAKAAVAGTASAGEAAAKKNVVVTIDWANLHERIHRITNANTTESELTWSPDGKKLAFVATVDGKPGIYTVEFPENLKVTSASGTPLSKLRWLESGIWGLSGGVPTQVVNSTTSTGYRFAARQTIERASRHAAIFDECWRVMRDNYYDERLGNRNWDAVRRKYQDAARSAVDMDALTTVIQLMLGELNGSHLGFYPGMDSLPEPGAPPGATPEPSSSKDARWTVSTAHLGVRFDPAHRGPGLKIRDVLPNGPAARKISSLAPGEVILSIDGTAVDPQTDLTTILNGTLDREFRLQVRGVSKNDKDQAKERQVRLRPISYTQARQLLYEAWILANRAAVDKLSNNKLGYLHISGMNTPSFYKFEEEIYSVGAGKEGLVIDVRENGGGSTTDHLLTVLTQPAHALTKPRGSNEVGYPQDRIVYATWRKPIIVLCNQNSFSNAEIFSHAIKVLKRGKVVGVPTAGGVISTGATNIMGAGTLRLPFRGWYHPETGEDMELNGAVPDIVIWPVPGEIPAGNDKQLAAAVKQLQADVAETNKKPEVKLRKAMER